MGNNFNSGSFGHLDASHQKQMKEILDQLQQEIKRINSQPNDFSGNPHLYHSLIEQILKIKEEVAHQDCITALNNAVESLKKAEKQAKNHTANKDILPNLQAANGELFAGKNATN